MTRTAADAPSPHRTVRLDEETLNRLLRRLDALDDACPQPEGERSERYPYHRSAVTVQVNVRPEAPESYVAPVRYITPDEISILHPGFLYPDTRCTVQLISLHGTWEDTAARVIRCRYLDGHIHEVAMRFTSPVGLSHYTRVAASRRILIADDSSMIRSVSTLHLAQLNCKVDVAENGVQALELATQRAYDLILMDMHMPEMDGFTAVRELRSRGYTGVVVAATSLSEPSDVKRCFDAGCDKFICKPYSREMLAELLEELNTEPLTSTYAQDPAFTAVIQNFVDDLPNRTRLLEEATIAQNLGSLASICRELRGEGTPLGFDPISKAAQHVESLIGAAADFESIRKAVKDLIKYCASTRMR